VGENRVPQSRVKLASSAAKEHLMTINNPFLGPPFAESQGIAWGRGFAFGFQGPPASIPPPPDLAPEDRDAFNSGVLTGQEAATSGFPVPSECVDLNKEPVNPAELVPIGFELFAIAKRLAKKQPGLCCRSYSL
jgi:hypothetical protein